MINAEITAPILFIGFNRPKITKKTFNYLRKGEARNLYIAIDGPRADKPQDQKLVSQVKNIVQNVDWDCNTNHKFNKDNKGAEVTVSSAISWVLRKEKYVIILEDDIIAPLSFLNFAQEMLRRYKSHERIGTVTGCNFTPIELEKDNDYFFAKYGHSWGWGTWRRVWKDFNLNFDIPDKHLSLDFLKTITNCEREAHYYRDIFSSVKENSKFQTWDHSFLHYFRVNNYLSVIPRHNLTSNIGTHGLHASGETEHHFRDYDEDFEVTNHPDTIEYNKDYDIYHFRHYINNKKPLYKRVLNKVRKILSRC